MTSGKWQMCHHRSGEPVWVNTDVVRRMEPKVQPDQFTRLVFGANDHLDVRETPQQIIGATTGTPDHTAGAQRT